MFAIEKKNIPRATPHVEKNVARLEKASLLNYLLRLEEIMKAMMFTISLVLCLLQMPAQIFAESYEEFFFAKSIARESLNIEEASPDDYVTLTDLHASRGEDYLILGEDQKALEDFLVSYEHAQNCEAGKNGLSFRPLLGAFLVNVRLENLEIAQEISIQLNSILKNACDKCTESLAHGRHKSNRTGSVSFQACHGDYPILGPDQVTINECLKMVDNTTEAIGYMIAAVKRTEVRVLAMGIIQGLADTASRCCRAGGLWKGCLQKLGNKLHYWRVFGVPTDAAHDQMP